MEWKLPPRIKVYEALGCVADGRVTLTEAGAQVFSSSRKKSYTVQYDRERNAVMANDNGSYWQGYLGYPAIALLLRNGTLSYRSEHAEALKALPWKTLNLQTKNDYKETERYALAVAEQHGVPSEVLAKAVDGILQQIEQRHFLVLGKKTRPPTGE